MNTVKPGTYQATAVDASLGETKDGNPYVVVTFELSTGEHVPWFGHFTDKTKHQTARALKSLGFVGDDIRKLETVRGTTEVTTENEQGLDGQTRSRVRFVGPRVAKELPADKAANFSVKLAGLFADNAKSEAPF